LHAAGEEAAKRLQDLYLGGRKDEAAAAVPDALVDEVAFCGPPERIREQLTEWTGSGVTTILVSGDTTAADDGRAGAVGGMPMRLKDRVAIVTGGASGIGAASALAMAREGARVLIVDVNEAGAKAIVEQVEKAGGQAAAARADVTRAADNQAIVEQAMARWGRVDVFYANAGVPQWKTDVEDVEEAVFDRIFSVNVKGVWLGAKYAIPVMKRQRRGVFLITASTSGIRPRPGGQTYAASKGAVITLTKALALEVAPHGVRVVAIAPVATHTPMLPTFMNKPEVDAEGLQAYVATVPLGRLNQPEDLAATAVFLASDDAAMITGSCVEVDGGRCI
jgi:3-oxoacyl-[acyl-carrier protein] reductase